MTVVALPTAKPGLGPKVIEFLREVSPLANRETGCELAATLRVPAVRVGLLDNIPLGLAAKGSIPLPS